jgi:hypothetical protein
MEKTNRKTLTKKKTLSQLFSLQYDRIHESKKKLS